MCYTIQQLEERIRKQGLRNQNTPDEIEKALELFRKQMSGEPMFKVSGFDHPALKLIVRDGDLKLESMRWGLIPHWVKDAAQAVELSNMTLNARGETIFEKRAFKHAALSRRALLPVTGFFEYQHFKGKKYPHFIDWKDEQLRLLACIWDEWENPASGLTEKTFSIVTTTGNEMMARIHNNPAVDEPRMPVILSGESLLIWLDPSATVDELQTLIKPAKDEDMRSHTVRPLRGKQATPNTQEAVRPYVYPELNEPLSLF
jgi:putative SOS response-associated peptidase YedK